MQGEILLIYMTTMYYVFGVVCLTHSCEQISPNLEQTSTGRQEWTDKMFVVKAQGQCGQMAFHFRDTQTLWGNFFKYAQTSIGLKLDELITTDQMEGYEAA